MKGTWQGFFPRIYTLFGLPLLLLLFGGFRKLTEPGMVGLLLFPVLYILLCLLQPGLDRIWFLVCLFLSKQRGVDPLKKLAASVLSGTTTGEKYFVEIFGSFT